MKRLKKNKGYKSKITNVNEFNSNFCILSIQMNSKFIITYLQKSNNSRQKIKIKWITFLTN